MREAEKFRDGKITFKRSNVKAKRCTPYSVMPKPTCERDICNLNVSKIQSCSFGSVSMIILRSTGNNYSFIKLCNTKRSINITFTLTLKKSFVRIFTKKHSPFRVWPFS